MFRRARTVLLLTAALVTTGTAPAAATVDPTEKARVLADWTQTSEASYTAWNAARLDQGPWRHLAFDWSTDGCSASPDQPLGFDFRISCQRHDFGYRNYRAAGQFPGHKARLDDAFHADLRRRCDTYPTALRAACRSLAWTYYNAVRVFGSLATVRQSDLDRAAALVE